MLVDILEVIGGLVLLIPPFGIVGAAVASATAGAAWNLSVAYAAWRRTGLRATLL